jgi:hypothetical protein
MTDGKNAGIVCNGTTDTIGQTVDDPLYCNYKWYAATNSAVPFRREIPVDQEKGVYQVRLHFAELVSAFAACCSGHASEQCWFCRVAASSEWFYSHLYASLTSDSFVQYFTAEKKRTFGVKVENVTVASELDVFASAGGIKKAFVIELNNTEISDGKVTIEFVKSVNNPILSGVEVIRHRRTCGIPKVRALCRSVPCSSGGDFGSQNFGLSCLPFRIRYSFLMANGPTQQGQILRIRFFLAKGKEERLVTTLSLQVAI